MPTRTRSAGKDPPVGRLDLADVPAFSVHLGHHGLEHETNAGFLVSVLEKLRHRGGERARHRPRRGLDHRDLGAGGRGRCREFEADEAGPDHHGSLEAGHLTPEGIRVGMRPQLQDAFEARPRHRQLAVAGARRHDEMVVAEDLAAGEMQVPSLAIDPFRPMVARHLDAALGEEGLGTKLQANAVRLAHEIGLGQRRALVGQAGFVAEKADPTAVAFVPQGGRDLKPSLASSDDDDTAT